MLRTNKHFRAQMDEFLGDNSIGIAIEEGMLFVSYFMHLF